MENIKKEQLYFQKPVLGFAAYSGTGKTTLLTKLLPLGRGQVTERDGTIFVR